MAECPCDRGTESAERLCSWVGWNNQQGQKSPQRSTKHDAVRDTRGWRVGWTAALLPSSSHDLQQEAEQVDDVQVDAEGGEYVFLRAYGVTLVPQQHLSVERQELQREWRVSRKNQPREMTDGECLAPTRVKRIAPRTAYVACNQGTCGEYAFRKDSSMLSEQR